MVLASYIKHLPSARYVLIQIRMLLLSLLLSLQRCQHSPFDVTTILLSPDTSTTNSLPLFFSSLPLLFSSSLRTITVYVCSMASSPKAVNFLVRWTLMVDTQQLSLTSKGVLSKKPTTTSVHTSKPLVVLSRKTRMCTRIPFAGDRKPL